MQSSQNAARMNRTKALPELGGIGGWLFGLLRGVRRERRAAIRQMHLLEILPLGGKRQLMLVSCAGEHFLVGGGIDGIATIVRVQADISHGAAAGKLDASCV
jgi:flagellar biogenesis protein FliO